MSEEYTEERYLKEQLILLQEAYRKAAKPYVDRLVALEQLRPRSHPLILTKSQAIELGIKEPPQ